MRYRGGFAPASEKNSLFQPVSASFLKITDAFHLGKYHKIEKITEKPMRISSRLHLGLLMKYGTNRHVGSFLSSDPLVSARHFFHTPRSGTDIEDSLFLATNKHGSTRILFLSSADRHGSQ